MKKEKVYQVIIIGGGPAGISAGLWCAELGLQAVLLEANKELGGQLLWTYNSIKNHLGCEAENGRELQKIFLKQIEARKLSIRTNCRIVEINAEKKKIKTNCGEQLSAEALIIATGVRRRSLGLENEERFRDRGILKSGKHEAEKVRGKEVCVVGGGDAALENALILADFARKVTLIHRREDFRARSEFLERVRQNKKIEILPKTAVRDLIGKERLEALEMENSDGRFIRPAEYVLLRLGVEPNTELFQNQLDLDSNGYCRVDARGETNIKNVYAVGDVAHPEAPTISGALGSGTTAVKTLLKSLVQ